MISSARKKEKMLAALAQSGNYTLAARAAKVSRQAAWKWRQNAAFQAKCDEAIEAAADLLEAEARRRAVEGHEEPVWYQGEIKGASRKYSDALLMFLLRGAKPAKYSQRADVTSNGQTIGKILVLPEDPDESRPPDTLQ